MGEREDERVMDGERRLQVIQSKSSGWPLKGPFGWLLLRERERARERERESSEMFSR